MGDLPSSLHLMGHSVTESTTSQVEGTSGSPHLWFLWHKAKKIGYTHKSMKISMFLYLLKHWSHEAAVNLVYNSKMMSESPTEVSPLLLPKESGFKWASYRWMRHKNSQRSIKNGLTNRSLPETLMLTQPADVQPTTQPIHGSCDPSNHQPRSCLWTSSRDLEWIAMMVTENIAITELRAYYVCKHRNMLQLKVYI